MKPDLRCTWVRIIWCDAAGIRRCRVVPRKRWDEVMHSGLGLAKACMFLPSWGDCPPADPAAAPVGEVRLVPDAVTLRTLPWNPTHAMVLATLCSAAPSHPWACCPRTALRRALRLLKAEAGVELVCGFESEFVLLKNSESGATVQQLHPVDASVYCQTSAYDAMSPVLDEMCATLEAMGDDVEQVHGESGSGQFEIVTACTAAMAAADGLLLRKEAISCVANRHKLVASFLPKLFAGQAGNGCHCHFSLQTPGGRDAMANAGRAHGLSEKGESFAAGVLHHLPALLAFTAASPNSYRRIAPSTWSGAYRCWGDNNREAPLRLVGDASKPGTLNLEVKCFDATANPHIGLMALVAAGLLGMRGMMKLPPPVNVDPAALSEEERRRLGVMRLPETLEAAVGAAERDSHLLAVLKEVVGGSEDLVRAYLAVKRFEVEYFEAMDPEREALTLCSRY